MDEHYSNHNTEQNYRSQSSPRRGRDRDSGQPHPDYDEYNEGLSRNGVRDSRLREAEDYPGRHNDESQHEYSQHDQEDRGRPNVESRRGGSYGQRSDNGSRSFEGSRYSTTASGQGGYGGEMQGSWASDNDAQTGSRSWSNTPRQSGMSGRDEYRAYATRSPSGSHVGESRPRTHSGDGYDDNYQGGYRIGQAGSPGDYRNARGPKGYIRSDEKIREDICECLTADPYTDASEISVNVKDGIATLEGTVEKRQVKHDIENIVESCMGVKDIENKIRVAPSDNSLGNASVKTHGNVSGTTGENPVVTHSPDMDDNGMPRGKNGGTSKSK